MLGDALFALQINLFHHNLGLTKIDPSSAQDCIRMILRLLCDSKYDLIRKTWVRGILSSYDSDQQLEYTFVIAYQSSGHKRRPRFSMYAIYSPTN